MPLRFNVRLSRFTKMKSPGRSISLLALKYLGVAICGASSLLRKCHKVKINASRMDAEFDGMATGLSTAITKDGQTTVTADLPMATYKHTGVGSAAARTDYAAAGQVQDGAFAYAADSGSANAYAMTVAPAITAYAAGQTFRFKAANGNTGASTLAVSGLAAKAIQFRGHPIVGAMISANNMVEVVYDGTQFQMISAPSGMIGHNLATNPAMEIAQVSAAVTGAGISTFTMGQVDEWGEVGAAGAARWTMSQESAGGVSGSSSWFKILCTTADAAVAAIDGMAIFNLMDGYKTRALLDGAGKIKEHVISFDVIVHKGAGSSLTVPLACGWPVRFSDPNRAYCASFAVAAFDTWERIDLVIPADTTAATSGAGTAFNLRHGMGLYAGTSVDFPADAWGPGDSDYGVEGGDNLADAVDNYVGITNVDVYPGTVARPFTANSYDHDFDECVKLFERINIPALAHITVLRGESTTSAEGVLTYRPKVTIPTYAVDDGTGFQLLESADPVVEGTSLTFGTAALDRVGITVGSGGTLTIDGAISLRADASAHYIDVDARMV